MLRVAHLAVPDNLICVAQTPNFPSIGEASSDRANPSQYVIVSDGDDMILCNPDPDGSERFLVETNVLQRAFTGAFNDRNNQLTEDSATMFRSSLIKIMVSSCDGAPTRRIIDPGFPIVVKGPRARLAVLAPSSAVDLDRGTGVTLGGGTPSLVEAFEIDIYARACRLGCWTPQPPHLTWWCVHENVVPDIDVTFVVPRGARRLMIGDVDANVLAVQFWQGDPNTATQTLLGQQSIVPAPAAPLDLAVFGSPTHIRFQAPPITEGQIYMVWEIE